MKSANKSDADDTVSSKSITQNLISGAANTFSKFVNRSTLSQADTSIANEAFQI